MTSMERDQVATRVAVVGAGRMGRHHARIYHELDDCELAAVVDLDEERAATVADACGCRCFSSVEALLGETPDLNAASVSVPTAHHGAAATPFLERGIPCLVEKPLASSSAEAERLRRIASEHGALLAVGHTERFNPAVAAVRSMGITPRFMEISRISPMTFRSLDVGVVMDMMIHDLDIVLTLADSPLSRVDAAGVAVLGEHEDVANARLMFDSGCVANLTASRLALKTERKMRLFSEDAYVSLDYQKRDGIVIRAANNSHALLKVRQQLADGADLSQLDYSELVSIDPLAMDEETDPLTRELRCFLARVRSGAGDVVPAEAGCAAIEAAEQVVEAIAAHRWEGLAAPRI